MMLTLLLSVAIFAPAAVMLWHAYTRACRNYIERHQSDAGIIAPPANAHWPALREMPGRDKTVVAQYRFIASRLAAPQEN
jgi:hypothetical protein